MAESPSKKYGGGWTECKLNMLREYLDAYTTALKNTPFKLLYIDAFAGTGSIELPVKGHGTTREIVQFVDDSAKGVIDGSAMVATKINDKKFDELIFIERNRQKCQKLKTLANRDTSRNIRVEQAEANAFLVEFCHSWQVERAGWRGVLFLDPFGAQVKWATIESIANTKALDMWIWIPVSGLSRMLPVDKKPEDISASLAQTLSDVFGGDHYSKDFYTTQVDLFQEIRSSRSRGAEMIRTVYKSQLRDAFGERLLKDSRLFYNEKNSPSFELVFCTGSADHKAIALAHKIASHIIKARG